MTSQISSLTSAVYKSRSILLEQMQSQGYDVGDYSGFSVNEVNTMKTNNQLDMILEKMDEDPAFYKKFSQMLRETIADYEAKRISEAQYLSRVQDIMNNVLTHTDNDIPEQLKDRDIAKAFYGLTVEALSEKIQDNVVRKEVETQTALQIDDLIQDSVLDKGKAIIDWQYKTNITGKLLIEIGDYLIDEVRDKYHLDLPFKDMDKIAEDCIEVAKIRYK